jgi:O-antigen/teichoic acid export membrane protein
MCPVKRPLKNIAAMLLGDGAARLIGFGVNVYLARILEPEGFGVISIGMAVLGYLLLVASPGIQTLETRTVAALGDVDRERVGAVLSLRLVLAAALWMITALLAVMVLDDKVLQGSVIRYAAAMIPLALLLDWFFAGRELFGVVGAAKTINAGVYGTLVLVFVHSGGDLLLTPIAFALGTVASAGMLAIIYRRRIGRIGLRWDPAAWRRIAAANAPVGLAVFLAQNVTNLPPIVVGVLGGAASAGQFSAALKLIFSLLMLDRLLNALFLPVMSRYAASRPEEVPQLFAVVGRTVLLAGVPITILGIILAPWIVPLIFGEGYSGAVGVFQILIPYVAMTLLSSVYVTVLIASGKERLYTALMIASTAVLAILVMSLTIGFGAAGAAWGVLGGEACALVLLARKAHALTRVNIRALLVRPLAVCLPMAAGLLLLPLMHPLSAALIALGILACSTLIAARNGWSDIRFLREKFL